MQCHLERSCYAWDWKLHPPSRNLTGRVCPSARHARSGLRGGTQGGTCIEHALQKRPHDRVLWRGLLISRIRCVRPDLVGRCWRRGSQDRWCAAGGWWERECAAGVYVRVCATGQGVEIGLCLAGSWEEYTTVQRHVAGRRLATCWAARRQPARRRRDSHKAGRWNCAYASCCLLSPAQWRGIAQRQLHRWHVCTGLSTAPSKREPAPVLGP